jgi:hypothetical protein
VGRFRSLVRIEHAESKLISRNGNEFKSFSALNDAIATKIRPISRAGWRDRLSRCREYSQWVGREELRLRAEAEQRLRVQTFLFRDGVAYHQDQKFLNTNNPTLFQELRALTHPERAVGVPDGI